MIGRIILALCLVLPLCSASLAADNSTAGNSTAPIARGLSRVMAVQTAVLTEDSQEMHMSLSYNGSFASAMVFYRTDTRMQTPFNNVSLGERTYSFTFAYHSDDGDDESVSIYLAEMPLDGSASMAQAFGPCQEVYSPTHGDVDTGNKVGNWSVDIDAEGLQYNNTQYEVNQTISIQDTGISEADVVYQWMNDLAVSYFTFGFNGDAFPDSKVYNLTITLSVNASAPAFGNATKDFMWLRSFIVRESGCPALGLSPLFLPVEFNDQFIFDVPEDEKRNQELTFHFPAALPGNWNGAIVADELLLGGGPVYIWFSAVEVGDAPESSSSTSTGFWSTTNVMILVSTAAVAFVVLLAAAAGLVYVLQRRKSTYEAI